MILFQFQEIHAIKGDFVARLEFLSFERMIDAGESIGGGTVKTQAYGNGKFNIILRKKSCILRNISLRAEGRIVS